MMSLIKLAISLSIIGLCYSINTEAENEMSVEWKEAWGKLAKLEKKFNISEDTGCKCVNYNCGCCLNLDIPKLHIDTNACVNVSYLPDQYGFSLTMSIGGKVYINETISAKNPPPICVGVPEFEKEASICLVFYNLDYTSTSLSGCIKLEAKLYHLRVQDVELGCFNFPLVPKSGTTPVRKAEKSGSDKAVRNGKKMEGRLNSVEKAVKKYQQKMFDRL